MRNIRSVCILASVLVAIGLLSVPGVADAATDGAAIAAAPDGGPEAAEAITPLPWLWWIAPIGSVAALLFAFLFYRWLMTCDEGDPEMQEIASHVREGAYAYLRRQYKVVALVFATEAHMVALQWEKTMPTPPVLMIGDAPETITSVLAAGIVDAVILDNVTAQMAVVDTPSLRVLTPPITDEPYTIAARKEDARLIEAISAILDEMKANGELDALIRRWMQ